MGYQQRYEAWLRDFAGDADTVRELQRIAGDEKEKEDRFYTDLSFGTAGMRGVLGAGTNRMNVYTVRRATCGLADYINAAPGQAQRGVVIAYDSRRMSAQFARQAALVLCAQGIRVYLFDSLRPVPALSFAVRELKAVAGIVITASHNPPQYNGYKVYWEDGAQLPPELAEAVYSRIEATAYTDALPMDEAEAKAGGLLQMIGQALDDAYIARVRTLCVQPQLMATAGKNLKIVYTPLHGSGNILVRRILREVGIQGVIVVPEQELPDPDFSTVAVPNPEDPGAFTLAMALADREGADCVFGTDPDCDRVGVAVKDGQGVYRLLTGNQIGCLLLYYMLTSRKALGTLPANGAVIKSMVTTELARAIAADFDVAVFDVLTGFKFIAEKIQSFEDTGSHTFLFGFEESYGYLSSTFVRDKDGVNASLLIAEAAAWAKSHGKTLYDVLQEIYATYGHYVESGVSVTLPGVDGLARMRQISARLRGQPPRQLGDLPVLAVRDYLSGLRTDVATGAQTPMGYPAADGVYYELAGGAWVCVRPSGTEPKMKLYIANCGEDAATAKAQNEALREAARALVQ
ncbi:MAG: phospho-sugar mutase [Oscillospiraceae bacterium]|jgi:phosphoglucomutase|nr:phospho-sugar mutase [Oscillospiraceae bacterium]